MTSHSLTDIARLLHTAQANGTPEMAFGLDDPRAGYMRLVRIVHPDRNGSSREAHEAFIILDELWKLALVLLTAGSYGETRAKVVKVTTKKGTYEILGRVGRDEVADRFLVRWGGGQTGYVRVTRKPRDNDLMKAEGYVLSLLPRAMMAATGRFDSHYEIFLPKLIEVVGVKQTGGVVRQANIFADIPGDWYSLQDVIDRYPNGVDPRDVSWIWRRLLTILGAAHRADALHGSVLPANVLIEPDQHGLQLVNWSFSVPRGGKVPAISPSHRDWYAPEVLAKESAGRGSDIYAAARTMLAIGGLRPGDLTYNESWPRPLRAHFRACLLSAKLRPRDAWGLREDFDTALERAYGPRRFRPFTMKGASA